MAIRRGQDVLRRHHEVLRLGDGAAEEWNVHGHLVAVEVGVEGGAHQRMNLDRRAFDQHRHECLDAQAVEGRGAVEQHRVIADHLVQDVPDFGPAALDHSLGRLDVGRVALVHQLAHDERLEELEGHLLGQAALVELELGSDHDHGAPRVVHALAEQVLAEPALLALQHVGERLQFAVAGARDRTAAAAVVDQRVDRFLEHPLLVAHDDLGRAELEEPLEAVVAVDHTAVEVVQVGRGEAATVELDHRAQLWWDDRQHLEHHPRRARVRLAEVLDNLQALDRLLLALAARRLRLFAQSVHLRCQLDSGEQLAYRLGANAGLEGATKPLRVVAELGVGEDLLRVQRLEIGARRLDLLLERLELALDAFALRLGGAFDLRLQRLPIRVEPFLGALLRDLGVGLELLDLLLDFAEHGARGLARHELALVDDDLFVAVQADGKHLARLRAGAGLDRLGRLLALRGQLVDRLLQLFLELGNLGVDLALELLRLAFVLRTELLGLRVDVATQADRALVLIHVEGGQHVFASLFMHVRDDVVGEVEDLLEVSGRHVQQQAHPARDALEVPDVAHRRGQLDVAHALAAHLGAGHLDAALVADDALVAVSLVLSAVAFPVPCRTEDALAEKTVALRAERAVVDGLGLRDLAVRPGHDRVGRRQRQL